MDKQKTIRIFHEGHQKFKSIIDSLSDDQLNALNLDDYWTTKDILAHISAWYIIFIDEISGILSDKPIWITLHGNDEANDEFNRKEIFKRKNKSLDEVKKEWEDSFNKFISTVEKLSYLDWNHICKGIYKDDGEEVCMQSLFASLKRGFSHEGEHAGQIRRSIFPD